MPAPRKEETRILPALGSKSYPAYVLKSGDSRPDRYRYIVQKPGATPELNDAATLAEARIMRAQSERRLAEHEQLTFRKAIAFYMERFVGPSGSQPHSNRTKENRLLGFFEPKLDTACARLSGDGGYVLYMGKVAPKLGPDGKPLILEKGYIHRPTKKPRGRSPGIVDRSGRGSGLLSGRYQGLGDRHQACQICGQVGHNRRAHRGKSEVVPAPTPDEERFVPPSVATHQAALREAKKFMEWLVAEGFITPNKDGKHPLSDVKPYGMRKGDGGFGKSKLTDEELGALDRACIFVLTSLPTFPEEVRLAWQQRAVAVLLCLRCGVRTGEAMKARRREWRIIRRACSAMNPPCADEHGGHVAGELQVVRENAKTGTSVRTIPVQPETMQYVLPLLEGKEFEHYFLAGAPRESRTGYGIGGANWERDPTVRLTARWLANSLTKLCDLAGIRIANPHSLRGSYVDSRVAKGDAFADVSRSAGHGRTSTTSRHYANDQVLAESDQRRMKERLGYGDNGGQN